MSKYKIYGLNAVRKVQTETESLNGAAARIMSGLWIWEVSGFGYVAGISELY